VSKTCGIVLLAADKTIQAKAKRAKLPVIIGKLGDLPFAKTLFVEPGTEVPWDLLPAAWHFLERWDAAVPLWRYSVNACDVGTKEDRKRTEKVAHDLRVLLHAVELLFIRKNATGQALLDSYRKEKAEGGEKRLAFLRALHIVKPRLCVLPRTWMAKIYERSKLEARRQSKRGKQRGEKLVIVEIEPGRLVKCHPGDEERVVEMLTRKRSKSPWRK